MFVVSNGYARAIIRVFGPHVSSPGSSLPLREPPSTSTILVRHMGGVSVTTARRGGPGTYLWTNCTMLWVFMKKTSRSAFRCRVAAWQSRMVAIWVGKQDRVSHSQAHNSAAAQKSQEGLTKGSQGDSIQNPKIPAPKPSGHPETALFIPLRQ